MVLGLENEGWFDPWLYLAALKTKAASFGVHFVHGEVIGFREEDIQSLTGRRTRLYVTDVCMNYMQWWIHHERIVIVVCTMSVSPWIIIIGEVAWWEHFPHQNVQGGQLCWSLGWQDWGNGRNWHSQRQECHGRPYTCGAKVISSKLHHQLCIVIIHVLKNFFISLLEDLSCCCFHVDLCWFEAFSVMLAMIRSREAEWYAQTALRARVWAMVWVMYRSTLGSMQQTFII